MNELLFLSKNDIPFTQAQLFIHQPTINQISFIGEDAFFTAIQFLTFSKNSLARKEQEALQGVSDFQIILKMLQDKSPDSKQNRVYLEMLLTLMFPDFKTLFMPSAIALTKDGENHFINTENFSAFKQLLCEMYCLDLLFKDKDTFDYNPGGERARQLAEKFKERQKKLAELKKDNKNEGQNVSILSRYISILSVGEQKDINSFMNYTVYQLFDQFQRFKLKQSADLYTKYKLAGAQDLGQMEDWMKNIHSKSSN